MFILEMVSCGTLGNFDAMLPAFTNMIVNAFKVVIPILLIIFGMIDLGKAVMSNDEKEMKGAQTKFIKRCIYAIIIFFIVAIVQLVFGMLDNANRESEDYQEEASGTSCISCFINNSCGAPKD